MVSINSSKIGVSRSGAGICLARSASEVKYAKPLLRVVSTSSRYAMILPLVDNSSGSVYSNGSSQSLVVIPPKVCSTAAAERKIYSPQEYDSIDFGFQKRRSLGMTAMNSRERS